MKQLFITVMLYILLSQFVMAEQIIKSQWFIQVGAYQSLNNALSAKAQYEKVLIGLALYDEEREFNNYINIHEQNQTYLVLIGPYPNKKDAVSIQENLPNYEKTTLLVSLKKDSYQNFELKYLISLSKISKTTYDHGIKGKVIINLTSLTPEIEKK